MVLLKESRGAVAAGCCCSCKLGYWCAGGLAVGGAAGTSVGRTAAAGREGANRGGCGWKREGRKGAAADCCCVLSS